MSIADAQMWEDFKGGSIPALENLMRIHSRPLFNYGSQITDDEDLIKDCIQDIFIYLWNRRAFVSDVTNPRAYLIFSLRRSLNRKIQLLSKRDSFPENDEDLIGFDMVLSVEQRIIEKEMHKYLSVKLAKVISGLPKRQKEVIYLKFFEEMSRDEIAQIMGISLQTVSNSIQIALKKLKNELESSGHSPATFHAILPLLPVLFKVLY